MSGYKTYEELKGEKVKDIVVETIPTLTYDNDKKFVGGHNYHVDSVSQYNNMRYIIQEMIITQTHDTVVELYNKYLNTLVNGDISLANDLDYSYDQVQAVIQMHDKLKDEISDDVIDNMNCLSRILYFTKGVMTIYSTAMSVLSDIQKNRDLQESELFEQLNTPISPLFTLIDTMITENYGMDIDMSSIDMDNPDTYINLMPKNEKPVRYKIYRVTLGAGVYSGLGKKYTDASSVLYEALDIFELLRGELSKLDFVSDTNRLSVVGLLDDIISVLASLIALASLEDINYISSVTDQSLDVDNSEIISTLDELDGQVNKVITNINSSTVNEPVDDLVPSLIQLGDSLKSSASSVPKATMNDNMNISLIRPNYSHSTTQVNRDTVQSLSDKVYSQSGKFLGVSTLAGMSNKTYSDLLAVHSLRENYNRLGLDEGVLDDIFDKCQGILDNFNQNIEFDNPVMTIINGVLNTVIAGVGLLVTAVNAVLCTIKELICLIRDIANDIINFISGLFDFFKSDETAVIDNAQKEVEKEMNAMCQSFTSEAFDDITDGVFNVYSTKSTAIADDLMAKLKDGASAETLEKLNTIDMKSLVENSIEDAKRDYKVDSPLLDKVGADLIDIKDSIVGSFGSMVDALITGDSCKKSMYNRLKGLNFRLPRLTIRPPLRLNGVNIMVDCSSPSEGKSLNLGKLGQFIG